MNITSMLYGAPLLEHVEFPTSEVLGPGATEDEIQSLIDKHKLIFIKPLFKGGINPAPLVVLAVALAIGVMRWPLLWVMAVTEFKLTFHGTSLGYAWSLIRPLLVFGVLLAVFTQVFRFGDSVQDYPALLLLNVMLFTLFGEATQRAVTSVVAREQVVRKAQFPRLVIPLSIVLTEILDLSLNLVAVFVFILVYGLIIFAYIITSWIRMPYSPTLSRIQRFLYDVCEPYLRIFRRVLPPIGPLDISPIIAIFWSRRRFSLSQYGLVISLNA